MALFYNLYDGSPENEHDWHVGEPTDDINAYGRQCVILQADCDELEAIREQFTNIPMSNQRVVRWTGEMAAFIAMNLK